MNKLMFLVMLLLSFTASSTPLCISGVITSVKYNSDNTMTIGLNNKMFLYTDRSNSH